MVDGIYQCPVVLKNESQIVKYSVIPFLTRGSRRSRPSSQSRAHSHRYSHTSHTLCDMDKHKFGTRVGQSPWLEVFSADHGRILVLLIKH
jgi:hypothetical protein